MEVTYYNLRYFFFFTIEVYSINIYLSITLAVTQQFRNVVFSFKFISKYFVIYFVISSWTNWLFRLLWFNCHIIVNLPNILLLLIFNFIALRQNIVCIISILSKLLRYVSQPKIRSTLESASCALEKNTYSAVLGGRECSLDACQVYSIYSIVYYYAVYTMGQFSLLYFTIVFCIFSELFEKIDTHIFLLQ